MSDEKKEIEKKEDLVEIPESHFLVAKNPGEMEVARRALTEALVVAKKSHEVDLKMAQENLAIAKKSKWRTAGLAAMVKRLELRVEFYEKGIEASEAGFYMVPNMEVDVFAIRTNRVRPKRNEVVGSWPDIQASEKPPLGEGEYVSPHATVESKILDPEDPKRLNWKRWAGEHQAVEFPFKLVEPAVLDATSQAMALKIFDDIGIIPFTKKTRPRAGDPMVIGRIIGPGPRWSRKMFLFVVAWFIDVNAL
jgi:hypothetical protein